MSTSARAAEEGTSARVFLALSMAIILAAGCGKPANAPRKPPAPDGSPEGKAPPAELVLRIGHFPNITHAQALIAHHYSRLAAEGKRPLGWFEERLQGVDGADRVKILWYVYNAGPSAMEAIFAGSIDMTWVGPNPAINAYAKSRGEEIRIVSGSAQGGAALVVRKGSGLTSAADFRGKRIATPQLGNTQDVSCRAWLGAGGLNVTQQGGDAIVVPTANPDQLALFRKGDLDGVWTVEPWVSRLEIEGDGEILLEEKDSLTTILASSVTFLREKPQVVRRFVEAHAELTRWIQENPAEARRIVAAEVEAETTQKLPRAIGERAWSRLHFTTSIEKATLDSFVSAAQKVGYLRDLVDTSRLLELPR